MFTGFLLSRSPRNVPEGGPRSDRRTNSPVPAVFDVTVRMAAPTDRVALERLAALDSARVPSVPSWSLRWPARSRPPSR